MSSKVIQVMYNDDDILMSAVKETRAAQHHIEEVYTPFPVHGLDKAMGLAPTRIAIASFMYGLVGLSFAIWLTNYTMIQDWPQNIGGKPSFTWGAKSWNIEYRIPPEAKSMIAAITSG